MSRPARFLPDEGIFHILTRGNNRRDTFCEAADYETYLSILRHVQKQHPFKLYHYCLMINHVHLLLETIRGYSLSQIMKKINLTYALYYKKKYEHIGHFWQDRFKSLLIEKDSYLHACAAYIELNPVKAGLVKDPAQYPYSSYTFYTCKEASRSLFLSRNPFYESLGTDEESRRKNYREFVQDRLEDYVLFDSKAPPDSGNFLKFVEQGGSNRSRELSLRTVPNGGEGG